MDVPKKLRKLVSIAAGDVGGGQRERVEARKSRERERGHDERENTWRAPQRDDTASLLCGSARGMMRARKRGTRWIRYREGVGREMEQGGPVGLYVIDEAVIATGLHSTPRYCHQTMHIHRPYK